MDVCDCLMRTCLARATMRWVAGLLVPIAANALGVVCVRGVELGEIQVNNGSIKE